MACLKGNVALITGGASGLGLALAERFLEEGASVAVLDRDAARVADTQARLGDRIEAIVGDVTTWRDNERAVRQVVDRFGRLDTFIANAGVFDNFESLQAIDPDKLSSAFKELFAVNVEAGLLGAKAAMAPLSASRGSMIFTLSNAGFYAGGGGALYTASKHALVGVVKQLAHELAPRIRVNGVAPGGMRTNLSGLVATGTADTRPNQGANFEEMLASITPLAIAPTPSDYCGPYVLLASRENAGPMTGVIINTDGGFGVRGIMGVRGGDAN
ncbi:Cis-2,3-dihydrobiphenyl-2,3-diol dehydrogenase [Burkholderia sp. lig30]|jgi:cis-2,3-dihydrobiphenyl-2,3-diol dehydrogenase|uniref:3-(cis-5,6-dihydroxycyclohexa-1, 3-dien-1-yl)propanoate dehydrogenase n=1 Tax=Burkholderia sp. lig30 TaxID=1192124 RepID=UPI000460E63F|nr:3-(cis-5,6-dihydroxycyclohexa-1,3-dien-1-yl)propanoate dehydrogenase [Burkholderia sp. lig30]KDB08181.1 Cis-2,3-dihydrobiphenyl-2,3-diol dehydrogenase [Burkholderia sp. lig30]